MRLGDLLKGIQEFGLLSNDLDIDISGIAYDSRKVNRGDLFVAIKGEKHDGHDFIKEAISKGASVIIHERNIRKKNTGVLFIKVKDSREALACIAHNFYGSPSENLTLIGVTGTNGKTTTTYILKSILETWQKEVGLIGTIQYMIKDKTFPAPYTTPESLEFHGLLKEMLLSGCSHVVTEVSSHALAQRRVDCAAFKVAVFTNLTRDHLDFHKNLEDYFKSKERLFKELVCIDGTCVINLDDPYGKRLISETRLSQDRHKKRIQILTYGIEEKADIIVKDIRNSLDGLRFKIYFRERSYDITSSLLGLTNIYNILSAVGASISLKVPWKAIVKGIEQLKDVKGRFERVELGQNFLCIVDYAHTEDALERLIYTAKEFVKNSSKNGRYLQPRIITVFGCGGNRDRGKRPKMGAIATRLSDLVIITSDNPRYEEPSKIIREIENGVVRLNYIKEPDRKEAIRKAVDMAGGSDILLIVGKGHEDYQEIKGIRYKFSDREVLEEALRSKLGIRKDA
ncbi:MAG: UDP-N-acetylmuramoyl-L-alanyl-D-glutamate--2,6-diaminopimelate ligase [Thermodesulfovibrionales bacterium]